MATPDEARADFSTRGLEVGGALYVESRTGLSLRLLRSDTDVYDLWSLSLGLFREW